MTNTATLFKIEFSAFEKKGDLAGLHRVLQGHLLEDHKSTLVALNTFVLSVGSKTRLKVFETLVNERHEDNVPVLMTCLRAENGILFLKSMLFLLKNMPYRAVLSGLMELESQLSAGELSQTFQRVTGHLKNIFRETFYMSEFEHGSKNIKKTKFSADMMIKEPHPEYLPFLHQRLLITDEITRTEAVRVLKAIGTGSSVKALFGLFHLLREEWSASVRFLSHLEEHLKVNAEKKPDLCTFLIRHSHLSDEDTLDLLQKRATLGMNWLLDQLLGLYFLQQIPFRQPLEDYLRMEDEAFRQDAFDKLKVYLSQHVDQYLTLIRNTLEAAGAIAQREHLGDFEALLQEELRPLQPEEMPFRLWGMASFPTKTHRDQVLALYQQPEQEKNLKDILEALSVFQLETTPEALVAMAMEHEDGILRKQAIHIIGKAEDSGRHLPQLLNHASVSVRVDTVRMLSGLKHQEGASFLQGLLQQELPNTLLLAVLEGLSEFTIDRVPDRFSPYLDLKWPIMIRLVAMKALVRANDPSALSALFEELKRYKETALEELFTPLASELSMLGSLEPFASVLFKHMPIWLKLINGKKSVIREGALDLILHFPWETEANLSNWIGVFREVGQTRELKRSPEEKRRLTLLVGKLHECNRQESQHTEAHEQLKSYLAALDNENYYQRLKALRNLNAQFREAMISNNPEGFDQLSRAIETLMTENEEHLEVLIQLFHLCAKLKDPLLLKQVKRMAEEGPGPIATAAQRFIQVAATQRPPIREIRKILLLDDSRYICNQLAHFLCEQGFKAQGSTDPFAAMDLLEQESFDLLLLDYRMPEMDGLSFLTEIRRRLLRPRFTVIVTSERDREVMLQFAEQQINGILFKPFKMDKLLEKIQMLTMTEEPNP